MESIQLPLQKLLLGLIIAQPFLSPNGGNLVTMELAQASQPSALGCNPRSSYLGVNTLDGEQRTAHTQNCANYIFSKQQSTSQARCISKDSINLHFWSLPEAGNTKGIGQHLAQVMAGVLSSASGS